MTSARHIKANAHPLTKIRRQCMRSIYQSYAIEDELTKKNIVCDWPYT